VYKKTAGDLKDLVSSTYSTRMINFVAYHRRNILKAEYILSKGFSISGISNKGRSKRYRKTANMGAPQEAITEDEIVGMELPDTKTNSKNACE
jgi:hypothetical protein